MADQIPDATLDEIEARANAYTGDWTVRLDHLGMRSVSAGTVEMATAEHNALTEYLKHARADTLLLTAEVRRLRAELADEKIASEQFEAEIIALRAELSSARAEMRERAAKVADRICRGHELSDAIRALPLEPEGEKT